MHINVCLQMIPRTTLVGLWDNSGHNIYYSENEILMHNVKLSVITLNNFYTTVFLYSDGLHFLSVWHGINKDTKYLC